MASLADQIDRLSKNTRAISTAAAAIAPPTASTAFTRAVLSTHLGDLIRDIDPSELGLFRLVDPPLANAYDGGSRTVQDTQVRRVDFSGATPLRKNAARRRDERQEIEPEVYAHAALKYIDRYDPIRPMPRAYDQIVTVLNRLNAVRANISELAKALEKTGKEDKELPTKARIVEEERQIKDLQARLAELAKLKDGNASKGKAVVKPVRPPAPKPPPPKAPASPTSPQEDKFWATKGEPSRTLRFSENLLDEEVNIGDVSSSSFGTPLAQMPRLKMLGDADDDTITQFPPRDVLQALNDDDDSDGIVSSKKSVPETPPPIAQTVTPVPPSTETPTARQRKVKVNIELERIVTKIWATVGDIIAPHLTASPLSVPDTIAYLEELSNQEPSPDSPTASSVSSTALEGGVPPKPNAQQIQYAYLITMLLSAAPHYSLPMNTVKENFAAKSKTNAGTTRVLFQGVAKRLIKIDRGRGEQIVKFDI
ncbi:hypothetical protein HYPSUDRAFT_62813 [Hypholoma sublateritium FD-334 SS-4]|uniref:Uncharacterized protein n=1 Tax=Hypholoma sublateritium (strain FD-334 SS-4) TaxID=945553 RepID=A0A0D2PA53_HYPSF|nr:hypothetical protein HYPSUDRAFT_62813 [Hypholoma sublateritium FD-334 SS-4]